MNYINKYLKYKNKYMLLKQVGKGPESYKLLDPRVLECISIDESPDDRDERNKRNKMKNPEEYEHPIYKIMENIDEIVSCYVETDLSSLILTEKQTIDRLQFIKEMITNINNIFNDLFVLMKSLEIKLFHIDARGDGNCFLNSLYIYTLTTKKNENSLYDKYQKCKQKEINYDDFKNGIIDCAIKFINKKQTELGDEIIQNLINELYDPSIPDINLFATVYVNIFNVYIIVIYLDGHFNIIENSTIYSPTNINNDTDYVIIINKKPSHFRLLIPIFNVSYYKNEIEIRKILFDMIKEKRDFYTLDPTLIT